MTRLNPGEATKVSLTCQIVRVPYVLPKISISFTSLAQGVPTECSEAFNFPIFYHIFFTYSRLQSVDSFRHGWDMLRFTSLKFVSEIFIGKFDFVKDELHLQQMFPGIVFVDKKEYKASSHINSHLHSFSVPFFQYGMVMKGSGLAELYWFRFNIDMTNTMFIECMVDNNSLLAKADFLLQHLIFVISE